MHPSPPLDNIRVMVSCLEVKRECYQNSSMLDCVTQSSQSAAHLYEQFLQVQQIGFVNWDPYTVRRGGCLELYYCNMMEWFWWDSSLILTNNWFPSVLWHCWLGHLAWKIVPEMTYNVLSGTLSLYTTTTTTNWRGLYYVGDIMPLALIIVDPVHVLTSACLHSISAGLWQSTIFVW